MDNDLLSLPPDAPPLLRRATIFVSTGDFEKADAYCERVLDAEPENAWAYLIKVMAKGKAQNAEQLVAVPGLSEQTDFKLARQFADPELAAQLDELVRQRDAAAAAEAAKAARREREAAEAAAAEAARREREAAEAAAAEAARRERAEMDSLRAQSSLRIKILQELLTWVTRDDLAAEVQKRLEAEQALMRSPTPDAAEREADATAAMKEKFAPIFRQRLATQLSKLEKIVPNQTVSDSDRKAASEWGSTIQALLADPNADLRTLGYESMRCKIQSGYFDECLKSNDIGLWIGVGVLILVAILVFAFLV